jgi:hypothetical protein
MEVGLMRITLASFLFFTIAIPSQAAPVRYVISSADTAGPDKAHWQARPLPSFFESTFLESEVDATLDHDTGFVNISRWDLFGPDGAVVYSVPPHSVQLSLQPPNADYAGPYPAGGTLVFRPLNVNGAGWSLHWHPDPKPSVDVPLVDGFPNVKPWSLVSVSIVTPEPSSLGLLAAVVVPIARHRRRG